MIHGDINRGGLRRRLVAGALALASAIALTACTTDEPTAAPGAGKAAPQHFGPAGYGKLTLTMTEAEALATGDLRGEPTSTIMGVKVHSFVDGPQPDPSQQAAAEKLAEELEAAEKDTSMAGQARAMELQATSMRGMSTSLNAFLTAGGAGFTDGRIDSIAAPADATTPEGIKRGATLAEVKAAYPGLESSSGTMHFVPVAGHTGWVLQFETENDTVKYMTFKNRTE